MKHKSSEFDYFVLRTEDLLDPATKYHTIRALAQFVGSEATEEEMCCMAATPATFMGSHSRGEIENGDNSFGVTKCVRESHGPLMHCRSRSKTWRRGERRSSPLRCVAACGCGVLRDCFADGTCLRAGKWQEHVRDNPELEQSLNTYGAKGLEVFGYAPPRDVASQIAAGGECRLTVEECEAKYGKRFTPPVKAPVKPVVKITARDPSGFSCTFTEGIDYKGASSDLYAMGLDTAEQCCEKCKATHRCAFFTFDSAQSKCFLKTTKGKQVPLLGLTSGSIVSTASS